MCDHEEILDNEGYVCIKCGLVLGQEYIYEKNSFNDQIKKIKILEYIQAFVTF